MRRLRRCKNAAGPDVSDFKQARETVLIVEDDPHLRMLAVDMVEDAGYAALEAAHALDAIAILETRLDIRLVFSDVDMPGGMDGVRLAAMIRDRWPPIHIILTSGFFIPTQTDLPADTLFFRKPYRAEEVIAAMRRFANP
jgi:CheY-like chemotaxis protein